MVDNIGPCLAGKEDLKFFKDGFKIEDLPERFFEGRSWKNVPPELLSPRFRKIYDNPKKYHAPNFFRRFAFGEINGTITASSQPEKCGITHPVFNRRYTVREIARIQSFPDNYLFSSIPLQSRYKVIGNAVPPVMGWVVAKALIKTINGEL
jgi:DNA (cytosine-5)-methyltransferase 1